ncbi:HD domain-containing phosphohydrolase [Poseidonibacter lekithochrous]|uniref:HD domain-containing phosphohydrolase n=1 Tax=Poseidonibacter lekithochrous TaxID=1904463 RepID=UPI0009F8D0CB|nr:HD domain-containing phosphohydrolase [Poseidonibacter lekithochrous]QKJ22585.1 response regulator c-di-GMP phosphodiesterase, RpfG family (PAS domain) [Poseidonibacter lekithochrous]
MGNMKFSNKNKILNDNAEKWKILISDDEEDVHLLTKTVLKNFEYKNKQLEFISAYSGKDTVEILKENDDIVLVLLDVIMENDHAGLEVVKRIREELCNDFIQIILRTGQSGQVLEDDVVMNYAINDYKEKTELTSQKLLTTITTSIRSFENMKNIKKLNHELGGLLSIYDEFVIAARTNKEGEIVYVTEAFCELTGYTKEELIGNTHSLLKSSNTAQEVYDDLWNTISSGNVWKGEIQDKRKDGSLYWLSTIISPEYDVEGNFLYYTAISQNITEKKAIEKAKIEMELANKEIESLNEEIIDTQKDVVFRLGAIAEARSKETGMHVKRVAEYSKLLALYSGLSEEEADIIKMASPMHDIGKVAIPDNILNKPGKFTDEEFEIMKTHAQIGYEMLKSSPKTILKAAAIIAHQHQEKYDGSGYPQNLKGEDIHIYGRITALADVFDALGSERVYKSAWSDEEIFKLFKEQRAKHFDPKLIDIFFEHLDEFLDIRDTFVDQ